MYRLIHLIFLLFFIVSAPVFAKTENVISSKYVILYVWDGLRPDAVTAKNTPNLYQFMKDGVQFIDNHATYPSFTMMNAASFATGDRAGKTGFYGNTLWQPDVKGKNATNQTVDFNQPIFTEDYKILKALNQKQLLSAETLFEKAHQNQMQTLSLGKSGPAFMQDYLAKGLIVEENYIYPLGLAEVIQDHHFFLPKNTIFAYPAGTFEWNAHNDDPTAALKASYFDDEVTSDPISGTTSPFKQPNQYLMDIELTTILPLYHPQLTVIWLRNPDSTEHLYGPGTKAYYDALKHNDYLLGKLISRLKTLGLYDKTDILVVSDHGHSHVSGPLSQFPLRNKQLKVSLNGLSVSGAVRVAHLMTEAGFHAYDGLGCRYNPIMSGINRQGKPILPTKIDTTGKICGKKNKAYTTPAYFVPKKLDKATIIVAPNGGSVYLYIPSHDSKLVKKIIRYLQSHTIFDVIFLDTNRYDELPGTIPLSKVHLSNENGRNPDIIVSLSYDANAKINGLPGIEFSDSSNERGMHGSLSAIDIHNFLAANGPSFKRHYKDRLPTGNIDVPVTIAHLLKLPPLKNSEGRVLFEALKESQRLNYTIQAVTFQSKESAQGLTIYDLLQKRQNSIRYHAIINAKILSDGYNQYDYFDSGKGLRD